MLIIKFNHIITMGYEIIEIDQGFNNHFNMVIAEPMKHHQWNDRFEHPHVVKSWADKI